MNHADVNIARLLGRVRRGFVAWAGIAENLKFPLLGFLCNLLAGSLPLLTRLGLVMVAVRGEGRGGSGMLGRTSGPVSRNGRAAGRGAVRM